MCRASINQEQEKSSGISLPATAVDQPTHAARRQFTLEEQMTIHEISVNNSNQLSQSGVCNVSEHDAFHTATGRPSQAAQRAHALHRLHRLDTPSIPTRLQFMVTSYVRVLYAVVTMTSIHRHTHTPCLPSPEPPSPPLPSLPPHQQPPGVCQLILAPSPNT